jgi:hypothetical protein
MRTLLILLMALPLMAAKPTTAECWFEDGWLYATGLPIDRELAVTTDRVPTGVTWTTPDGSFAANLPWVTHAVFWSRKGGQALFKPGAGLNDYKPIAECFA